MMQNTAYRLAEFKIIENTHGDLWWETHIGLGSLKTGKSFINGDILFLVPSDITGPGFLKGEFLDHLNKLPKWKKTKYYCASYKISECQSGSQIPLAEGTDIGVGKIAMPSIVNENSAKDNLTTLFKQFQITVVLILRILLKCTQMIWRIAKVLTGKWTRFRG